MNVAKFKNIISVVKGHFGIKRLLFSVVTKKISMWCDELNMYSKVCLSFIADVHIKLTAVSPEKNLLENHSAPSLHFLTSAVHVCDFTHSTLPLFISHISSV